MAKLVVLKLDGDLSNHGCRVTLEIGAENLRPEIEISGSLPAFPELASYLCQWQDKYCSLRLINRIKPEEIIYDGCITKQISECSHLANILSKYLQIWLDSQEFRFINNTLREELSRDEVIRVLIRTDNIQLQRLPWHLWDFFNRYSLAEFALSTTISETPPPPTLKPKVRILAILGNSTGINVQKDRQILSNLPDSEIVFLVEPQREKLNNYLWQQWDILFFAGHSETADGTGRIYINKTDSLTIDELKYGLKRAIALGLQLAIFNSCDGLGLAWQLAPLHIGQMIVMRSPVPDEVAQEFLKHFLTAFSGGKSLYLATREAREKLQGLEDRFPNATWLPVIFQNLKALPPTWKNLYQKPSRKHDLIRVTVVSLLIAILVIGARHLGMLQTWELHAYDHLMQVLPASERLDPRLVVVTVDEDDIRYQNHNGMTGRGSLSDRALAQLLEKLEQYQPVTIGIDIYHDHLVDKDYPDLIKRLQQDNRIFAVCKVSDSVDGASNSIEPPSEVPRERQTFTDFMVDDDDVLRRQLLQLNADPESHCGAEYAFSLQVARHYLEAKGVQALITQEGYLQIGNVLFKPLKEHTSGYQKVDASGYQVLLNYRSLHPWEKIANTASLKAVLNNQVNPETLKNRIVLIGVTAPSAADYWQTPSNNQKQTPGVFVQGEMISHILSAVLDRRPLLWWWPEWVEALWVWLWSLVGGILVWRLRLPLHLGLAVAGVLLTLFGICFGMFTIAGWIPLVPSALALLLTATVILWRLRKYK